MGGGSKNIMRMKFCNANMALLGSINAYTAPATPPATNDLVICIEKGLKPY